MRSHASFLAVLAIASAAFSGVPIFSNAGSDPTSTGLSTGPVTLSGISAPPGAQWSEAASDLSSGQANAVAGFSSHLVGSSGPFRFADNFVVPASQNWRLEQAAFFAYQTGAAGPQSPFAALNLRLWRGQPGAVGSSVVFGDTVTNRLASSAPSNLYRVFNSMAAPQPAAPDTTRLIWETRASVGGVDGVLLTPGEYWLDWQYTLTTTGQEAFSPPITSPGSRTRTGANALQFKSSTEGWVSVVDPGKPASAADLPQDLPFVLYGSVMASCPGDADLDGSVGISDVLSLIGKWGRPVPPGTEGDLSGDGVIGVADLAESIKYWASGCP